jgi:hypothetical protein
MSSESAMPPDPDDRPSDGFGEWLDALADARDEDALFALLAGQRPPGSKLARQQLRGRLLKLLTVKLPELGSSATAAKTADAWLHEGGGDADDLQGRGLVADEITPWPHPVGGADALNEVADLIDTYPHSPDENRDALTLWIAYSHVFDCFGVSPILNLASPTKRCGKSTTIVLLRHLCPIALLSGNISPAALFRSVEAWRPTLLIDEADSFARMSDELRGILNAGHTRDTAFVIRAEGDANEPRLFSTWAPKAVAAIGHLPDTIEDRSIPVSLTRKPVDVEKRDAFDSEQVRTDCADVRRRVARFVLDNLDAVASTRVDRPKGLHDRAWNNWRPLFVLAEVAGDDWPERAARAARALSNGEDVIEDYGTLALRHVWEAVQPVGRMKTSDVLAALVARDDSDAPWAKWWEAKLAKGETKGPSASLAKLLRPFDIRPRQLWIGERNERGYDAEDFRRETVLAYLEKDASDARDPRNESPSQAGSSVLSGPSVFLDGARTREQPPPGAETNERIPVAGEPGYLMVIDRTFSADHLTEAELRELQALHRFVRDAI